MIFGANSDKLSSLIDSIANEIINEQKKINKVKAADNDKKENPSKLLKEYEQLRGRNFFFNYVSSGRGNGPLTELIDGSIKYDLINAIGVNILGHAHPINVKAHLETACSDVVMCGNLLTYQEPHALTKKVLEQVKKSRLKHFWYAMSGSCANDTALKIIWQKKAPNYKILALDKAFAGRTVATQDITYNASYREGMPKSVHVEHVPNYDYKNPNAALEKTIKGLEEAWAKAPGEYCALMLELIQGEGGFIFGTREYYEGLFKWAKDHGLYVWIDEVQSFGRTHELFAFQHFKLDEYVDVVTIGKALQACGVFYTAELNPKAGLIAGTFNGSLAALNAGLNTVDFLTKGNFYGEHGRNKKIEQGFISRLNNLKNGSCKGKIGHIGGVGTMIAFEVGDASKAITDTFLKVLFENGIIAFSAGSNPVRVRFLIPVIITDEQIDDIFKIIEKTILEVIK